MQDLISKTHAFAFINHLEFISPDFQRTRCRTLRSPRCLERMPAGYYNTDLGNSLDDFQHEYLDTMDSRTTFIVVGDGRNNYNDPRLDIVQHSAQPQPPHDLDQPGSPGLVGQRRQRYAEVRAELRRDVAGQQPGPADRGGRSTADLKRMDQQQAGYREVEHTADWELEVWALDLEGLLEQSARGMYDLAGMRLQPVPRLERSLALIADDPENLLVKFLSELLYFTEQEQIGFDEYQISLEGFSLHAEPGGRAGRLARQGNQSRHLPPVGSAPGGRNAPGKHCVRRLRGERLLRLRVRSLLTVIRGGE